MSRPEWPEHEFTLVVDGIDPQLPDKEVNTLYEAGCDDATIASRDGRVFITFSRRAPSLLDAILSAIGQIESALKGAQVIRVASCELVTQAEIARRIGRNRATVNQYIKGKRGPGGFPPPACILPEETPLWHWCDVAQWLYENDMLPRQVWEEAKAVSVINTFLRHREQHRRKELSELVRQVEESFPCCE